MLLIRKIYFKGGKVRLWAVVVGMVEIASERERTSGAWGCRVQRLYRDIQFHRAQMRPVRGLSSFAFLFFSLFQF